MSENVNIAVRASKGQVALVFPHPLERIDIKPEVAIDIAEAIAAAAFECNNPGVKPVGDVLKAELIERKRKQLIVTLAHSFNSLREDRNVSHLTLAQHCVETCFREVF